MTPHIGKSGGRNPGQIRGSIGNANATQVQSKPNVISPVIASAQGLTTQLQFKLKADPTRTE
jgi:hypothetical protein